MKSIFVGLGLISCLAASAAIPTPEGLLRNANNQDLSGNTVSLKFSIAKADAAPGEGRFYKVLFTQGDEGFDMAQLEYPNSRLEDSTALHGRFIPKVARQLAADGNQRRGLFYGVLSMLTTNSSKGIAYLFKRINKDFPFNDQLMNEEQIKLYNRQKRFLGQNKGVQPNGVASPFRPLSDEDRLKVNEILTADMYRKTEFVRLEKEGDSYYWKLKLDKIEALFTNQDHRIERLAVDTSQGLVEYDFADYVLFDGVHELPKTLVIKDSQGQFYRVRMLGLSQGNNLEKKALELSKGLDTPKNRAAPKSDGTPDFVY